MLLFIIATSICFNSPKPKYINDIIKRIVNGVPEPVAIQKITRPVNLFLNYCMVHCEFGNTDNLESPLEQNKTIKKEGEINKQDEKIKFLNKLEIVTNDSDSSSIFFL